MRKLKAIAVGIAAVFLLVAVPTSFAAANNSNPQGDGPSVNSDAKSSTLAAVALPCSRLSAANTSGQDIFLSTASPRTYTGTAWQNVECTNTTFRLNYGERALVVSDFNAESDCTGTNASNGQWCETRALLNGSEGRPVAAEPSSFAFDNVSGPAYDWQAHNMKRAWEVRCAVTSGCQYRHVVQTKMHDSTVTGLWLDEVAVDLRVTKGGVAPL